MGLLPTKHFAAAQEMGNQLNLCDLGMHGSYPDLVQAQLSELGCARAPSTSTRFVIVYFVGPIRSRRNTVYVPAKPPPPAPIEIELDSFFQRDRAALLEWVIFAIEVVDAV